MPGSERLAEFLLDTGAVRLSADAPVSLPTGKRTPIFCDYSLICDHPQARQFVVDALASRVRSLHVEPDVIVARSRSQSGCAAAVAKALGLPFAEIDVSRAVPQVHGITGLHVVLLDDLIVTARSMLPVVTSVRAADAVITDVVAILTYGMPEAQEHAMEAGVMVHALTTADLLVTAAVHQDRIGHEAASRIRRFIADPSQGA